MLHFSISNKTHCVVKSKVLSLTQGFSCKLTFFASRTAFS